MSLRTVAPQTKYGLIKKPKATVPLKVSAFASASNDDSDDDSSLKDVSRVNSLLTRRSAASERAATKIYSDALAEDPSAFEYDDAYDSFKAVEVKSHALSQSNANNEAPKSRYITNLMNTASVRGKERDRIYEKKLLKDRKLEDEEYGDKPKFMTTAYKQKLIEDQKWEVEDKLTDEIEARTDVRSQGMHGFYSNLLTKNVAMGGDVEGSALSAYTAGSQRQSKMSSSSASGDQDPVVPNSEITTSNDSVVDHGVKRKFSESDHDAERHVKGSVNSVVQEKSASLDLSTSHSNSEILTSTVPNSAPPAALATSKDEIISSARQRFLDRKSASST